jgi:hypothetical protein
MTEETRQKMKDSWTDERRKEHGDRVREMYNERPELREKISETHKGKPKSKEQKEKMREAKLGKQKSPEHKQAMKDAHRKRCYIIKKIQKDEKMNYYDAQYKLSQNKDYYYNEVYPNIRLPKKDDEDAA